MSTEHPLPPHFDLVELDAVDCVVAEALRRGRDGAGEGTLVWARRQSDARTPSGGHWHAPSGNLHCALLLEPDYPNDTAQELAIVATVAAGTAIAGLISPMTGLRYRWPGWILLNGLRAGNVRLAADGGTEDPVPRVAIGLSVNVADHPTNPEPERYNSVHHSGSPEVEVFDLLDAWSRHFLSLINRWADEGLDPVLNAYRQRLDGVGEVLTLHVGSPPIRGSLAEVDGHGGAVIDRDGARETVSLARYYGLFGQAW